jgi:hypothetical protein
VSIATLAPGTSLNGSVTRLLANRWQELLHQNAPPRSVAFERRSSAVLASLTFEAGNYRLAVKQIPASASIRSPRELARVHMKMRTMSPCLARCTPNIAGSDEGERLVVMEFIPGPTLLDRLIGRKGLFFRSADECGELLDAAGVVLGEVNAIAAEDVGVTGEGRTNGSFLPRFQGQWAAQGLAAPHHLDRLLAALPADFADRAPRQLLAVDAQPKNVLVTGPGRVCFIDPDYRSGNPAIGVAHFLVSMDRAGLRRPLPGTAARIAGWQRRFLEAYFRMAPRSVAEDLLFFYPWMLDRCCELHSGASLRLVKGYLEWYYARRMTSFLRNLDRVGPASAAERPAELFMNP